MQFSEAESNPIGLIKSQIFVGILLAISILLMFVNFWIVTVKSGYDKNYMAITSELRILSQSIAKNASSAADGVQDAFVLLKNRRNDFDAGIDTLINGDPKIGLPPTPTAIQGAELATLHDTWKKTREKIDAILNRQSALQELQEMSTNLNKTLPQLQTEYQNIIDVLLKKQGSVAEVAAAAQQKLMAEKMLRSLDKIMQGGQEAVDAADSFSRESTLFGQYLEGMKNGDATLGIPETNGS